MCRSERVRTQKMNFCGAQWRTWSLPTENSKTELTDIFSHGLLDQHHNWTTATARKLPRFSSLPIANSRRPFLHLRSFLLGATEGAAASPLSRIYDESTTAQQIYVQKPFHCCVSKTQSPHDRKIKYPGSGLAFFDLNQILDAGTKVSVTSEGNHVNWRSNRRWAKIRRSA